MRNRNRVAICSMVFMSIGLCSPSTACVIYPPVAVSFPDPAFWPVDALGHVDIEIDGSGSYDTDPGSPECCDWGIDYHDWSVWATCGSGWITWYCNFPYEPERSCVHMRFTCPGRHYVWQWVTDLGGTQSEETQSYVWAFDISASLSQSVIGVGDTATLTMNYSPYNLPGYEKLTLNPWSVGVIEVLQGAQVVIGGADTNEIWALPGPSTVTVKGVTASPIQGVLYLQFWPDGATSPPCTTYNGNSVSVSVVGVYQIEVYASQWYQVTGGTITVLQGAKYTFRATPNPPGTIWPPQRPVWMLNGNQIGAAGDTSVELTFDSVGTKTLTAKCGSADPGGTVTINVILPVLNTVEYRQNHVLYNVATPEYQRNPSQNEPGCWTVGTRAEARVTFWHSSALTYPTGNIVVRAETSGDSYNIEDWGDSAPSTLGTNWTSSVITCVAEGTMNGTVQYRDYSAQWKYK